MLARIFVIVGGFIVLALFAALVAPFFIDWTGYRASFEREASAIVGRPVKVMGKASARLLPFPSVTFTQVEIGGGADATPATTVDEFSMDAELAPFLRGEVLIFDMRLVRPVTIAWIDGEGKINWAIDPHAPVAPGSVSLERLTITDGTVRLSAHGVPDRLLSDINLLASARSLSGPWKAAGNLKANGYPLAVDLSTGIATPDGTRLKLRIEPEGQQYGYDLEGNVTSKDEGLLYGGEFRIARKSGVLAVLRDGQGGVATSTGPGNRVSGKFELSEKQLSFKEFRFEAGPLADPYVATGTASVTFGRTPSFEVKATGAQVRLGDDKVESTAQVGLLDRLGQIEDLVRALPVTTVPGTVEVDLPAIVADATIIRDVKIAATTQGEAWQVDRMTASLPGRTTIEASGSLDTGDEPRFAGRLLVAVAQPSGFASWLATDIDESVRQLSRVGLSADVVLSRRSQVFNSLELALGKARFKGNATRTIADGQPMLTAALEGGAVSREELTALGSVLFSEKGKNRLKAHNIAVSVKAGPVGTAPVVAAGLDFVMRMSSDVMEIDRLSVSDLAGASIASTGRVDQVSTQPEILLDSTIVSQDLAPLVKLIAATTGNRFAAQLDRNAASYPDLLRDAQVDVVAKIGTGTPDDHWAFDVKGISGGGDLGGHLEVINPQAADAAVDLSLHLSNPNATNILALAGVPVLPLELIGAAEATVTAKGELDKGLETHLTLSGDDARASFMGEVIAPDTGFQVQGKVDIEAADAQSWLMTAGVALPGMGEGLPARVSFDIDYSGGLLVADNISGAIAERQVSGELNIEAKEGAPVVSGQLALEALSLEPLAEMVLGAQAFEPAETGWPVQTFQQMVALPFLAEIDLSAETLMIAPDVAVRDARLSIGLDESGLHVPKLEASLEAGRLSGMFDLKNEAATGLFSAQFKLENGKVETLLGTLGTNDPALSGGLGLSGFLAASGKTVSAMVASLAGSGTVSIKGLEISGINPHALPSLLSAADDAGRDIDATRVADFAPAVMRGGKFDAGDLDASFSVAGGVVRLPSVSVGNKPLQMSADMQLNLSSMTLASTGMLRLDPGPDRLSGSMPEIDFSLAGPIGQAVLKLNTQPLTEFLTQRALEIEQVRVEQMQSVLLEKQRLRRESRFFAALDADRRAAVEAKLQSEREAEAARLKAEKDALLKVEKEKKAEAARLEAERASPEPERQIQLGVPELPAVRPPELRSPKPAPVQSAPPAPGLF